LSELPGADGETVAECFVANDSGMLQALLSEDPAKCNITAQLVPTASAFVPKYGRSAVRPLAFDASQRNANRRAERPNPRPTRAATDSLSPRALTGGADYGPGTLKTVRDIVDFAERRFNQRFWYDSRLSTRLVFISGKYTAERFEACMSELLRVDPSGFLKTGRLRSADVARSLPGLSALVDAAKKKGLFGDRFDACESGQNVPLSDLKSEYSGGVGNFGRIGVGEDSSATLGLGIMICIDCGGIRPQTFYTGIGPAGQVVTGGVADTSNILIGG